MSEKKKFKIGIHAVLGLVILGIIVFMVIKLLNWQSRTVTIDTNVEEGSFDMENLDFYVFPTEDQLAARKDDGVNNILVLGNAAISSNGEKHSVLNELKKRLDNAEITSLVSDKSKVTCEHDNDVYITVDAYCLYNMVNALISGNYTPQAQTSPSEGFASEKLHTEFVENFKNLDMKNIDTILIMYSLQDYYASMLPMYMDGDNVLGYHGSLNTSIKLLQENFPWVSIILASPYPEYMEGDKGEILLDSTTDFGQGNGSVYLQHQYAVATERCISYIDNYYYKINEENITDYVDSFFLKKKGIDLVAEHIADFINNKGKGSY